MAIFAGVLQRKKEKLGLELTWQLLENVNQIRIDRAFFHGS